MESFGYTVFEEVMNSEETGSYVTYGIRLGDTLVEHDVSLNREEARELAGEMTEGKLDPVHFYDVLEDFYGSQAL